MKKSIKTIISFMTITLLMLSLSSCTIFEAMRQNALEAAETTIYATPEDEKIISEFNALLASSKAKASEIKENISYSAGTPDVLKDGEEAGVLDSAANQLKNFIMSANPGSTSRTIEKDATDSLLNTINEAAVLKYDATRNLATVNITDEDGKEVYDEEGNVMTEQVISDNILHLTFNYFADEIVPPAPGAEPVTDAEGNAVEETTVIYADDATIESVFGTLKDKEAVLKNFENIKDYITVSDYEIKYNNCLISSDANIETGEVSFVNFQKNMTVTAKAEGVGSLASYGEIEIVFTLTQNINYEFSYAEEETLAEDTTAAIEDTTVAEETTLIEETTLTEETTVA